MQKGCRVGVGSVLGLHIFGNAASYWEIDWYMGYWCRGVGFSRKSFFWTQISHFSLSIFIYFRSAYPSLFLRFSLNGTCIDFGTDLQRTYLWWWFELQMPFIFIFFTKRANFLREILNFRILFVFLPRLHGLLPVVDS